MHIFTNWPTLVFHLHSWLSVGNTLRKFQMLSMHRLVWAYCVHIWASAWQTLQNGMCAQRRLRSAWASAQSDQSLRWALNEYTVAKDQNFPHADSEDTDQTGWMPRLIWIFTGRTCHFVGFAMRGLISKTFFSEHTWTRKAQISVRIWQRNLDLYLLPFCCYTYSLVQQTMFTGNPFYLSYNVRKRTVWHMRPTKIQISLHVVWSEVFVVTWRN